MVVAVAGDTIFTGNLCRCMVTLLKIGAGFQFQVAGQAFLIGNLGPQRMAMGTVRHPLEMGMGVGQFPRRYLSIGHPTTKESE